MIFISKYKFNHYVPTVYTKAWKNEDNKIWLCDEYMCTCKHPEKELAENSLYIKTCKDSMALNEMDKEEIFSILDSYDIEYKGQILKSVDEYILNYDNFDEWKITQNGLKVKKRNIKNIINQKKIKSIELNFDKVENGWNNFIVKINEVVLNVKEGLNYDDISLLKEFIFLQKYRTLKYKHELEEGIKFIFKLVELPDDLCELWEPEFVRSHFIKAVETSQSFSDKGSYQKIYDLIQSLQVVFFIAVDARDFITSDNPVCQIVDNQFYKGKFNGLYLPLTPKIVCGLFKGNNHQYTITKLADNKCRKLNRRFKDNKYKFYISSQKPSNMTEGE